MFRFDFGGDGDATAGGLEEPIACASADVMCPVELIDPSSVDCGNGASNSTTVELRNGVQFHKVIFDWKSMPTSAPLRGILRESDLKPNVYEGGLKVWECSIDLVDLFADHPSPSSIFTDVDVLELGCGHALPGIYALQHGARSVTFQDLNREVLINATVPNVALNCAKLEKARFIAGDWFDEQLESVCTSKGKFGIILTCDTLYCVDSYQGLLRMIDSCLEMGGSAYIAAKSFYFGVGGSTASFLAVAESRYPHLIAEQMKTIEDGVSNVRQIIRLTKSP